MSSPAHWSLIYVIGLAAIAVTADLLTGWRIVLAWSVVCPILWWISERSPYAKRWKETHRRSYGD